MKNLILFFVGCFGSLVFAQAFTIHNLLQSEGAPLIYREPAAADVSVKMLSKKAKAPKPGVYTVQVAAFEKKAEAIMAMSELQSHGFDAFHTQAMVKGKKYFRVNVGWFYSYGSAWNFKSKSKKDGADSKAAKKFAAAIVRPISKAERLTKSN